MPKWIDSITRKADRAVSAVKGGAHATAGRAAHIAAEIAEEAERPDVASRLHRVGQREQLRGGGSVDMESDEEVAHTLGRHLERGEYGEAAAYLGSQIEILGRNAAVAAQRGIVKACNGVKEFAKHPVQSTKEFGEDIENVLSQAAKDISEISVKEALSDVGAAIKDMCAGAMRSGTMALCNAWKALQRACGVNVERGQGR